MYIFLVNTSTRGGGGGIFLPFFIFTVRYLVTSQQEELLHWRSSFSRVNALGFVGCSMSSLYCVFVIFYCKKHFRSLVGDCGGLERRYQEQSLHILCLPPFPKIDPIIVFFFLSFLTISQENDENGWRLLILGKCLRACVAIKVTFGLSTSIHFRTCLSQADRFFRKWPDPFLLYSSHSVSSFMS